YNEFVTDFETVLQFVKKEQPQQKIGVWAFSMGTLVATLAYKETPFDVMIGEAFVVDPPTTVKRIQDQKNKTLILPKGAKKVKKTLHRINIPMLVVCGTKDEVTTLEDGKMITQHYKNRRLFTFEGGHLQGARVLGFERYLQEIKEILI
ncbi:MAG: alpha/beta hydrolase, partial [Saprospiraceae bacterium]